MKQIGCFFLFMLLYGAVNAQRTLSVGGADWTVPIPTITEAGADYAGTYESANNQIQLTFTVPLLLSNGTIAVRYDAAPTWNSALILRVKRNDNGSSINLLSSLNGGTTYQDITSNNNTFFIVSSILTLSTFTNVSVQLQLGGVSVTIPTGTYQSRVVFTIGP